MMGDTWITDMMHFLDIMEPDADIPDRTRRLAEYFGKIVEAATSRPALYLVDTEVRCRRRPKRKPCPGHIRLVCNEDEGEIVWECTSCDDHGIIRGFEGTPWDRSIDREDIDAPGIFEPLSFEPFDSTGYENSAMSGGPIAVILDNAEYAVVRRVCRGKKIPSLILDNAELSLTGSTVTASARNIAAFHHLLLDIAISEKNPSHVQLLGQTVMKMGTALDEYLDAIF
jgi:hypothetical protein